MRFLKSCIYFRSTWGQEIPAVAHIFYIRSMLHHHQATSPPPGYASLAAESQGALKGGAPPISWPGPRAHQTGRVEDRGAPPVARLISVVDDQAINICRLVVWSSKGQATVCGRLVVCSSAGIGARRQSRGRPLERAARPATRTPGGEVAWWCSGALEMGRAACRPVAILRTLRKMPIAASLMLS